MIEKIPAFSKKYAQSVTLEEFKKQHAHLKGYDLKAIWEHYNPKIEKKAK